MILSVSCPCIISYKELRRKKIHCQIESKTNLDFDEEMKIKTKIRASATSQVENPDFIFKLKDDASVLKRNCDQNQDGRHHRRYPC